MFKTNFLKSFKQLTYYSFNKKNVVFTSTVKKGKYLIYVLIKFRRF